jgi:hypothetical protein
MLENGARLERPRVLGVRVELAADPTRASPAPEETATLRWLVASPEDLEWSGAIAACLAAPTQTGVPRCAGEPFAFAQSTEPSLEPTMAITLPPAAAFEGSTGQVLLLGSLCAGGTPTLEGCDEDATDGEVVFFDFPASLGDAPPNRHPSIADETFTYDERAWASPPLDVPSVGCAARPDDDALPHVPWRAEEDAPIVAMTTRPEDREPYLELVFGEATPTLVESREELTVALVIGAGELPRRQTVIFDDAALDVTIPWTHPPREEVPADGLTVELIAIARDGRGGMDWTRRALCLVAGE